MSATNNVVTTDQLNGLKQPINDPNAPVSAGDDPMTWTGLEDVQGSLPGHEDDFLPPIDGAQDDRYTTPIDIPATGVKFDIRRLDNLQTQEEKQRETTKNAETANTPNTAKTAGRRGNTINGMASLTGRHVVF